MEALSTRLRAVWSPPRHSVPRSQSEREVLRATAENPGSEGILGQSAGALSARGARGFDSLPLVRDGEFGKYVPGW